jgi:putative restriction endonuclease
MVRQDLWNREETILALNLYFQTPYGRIHGGNNDIRELSEITGRSRGSVGRKMQNLAGLDPVQIARGIKGLTHYSKLDKEIFAEFSNNWAELAFESQRIKAEKKHTTVEKEVEFEEEKWKSRSGVDVIRSAKTRSGQNFFRNVVLNNFDWQCAISGIDVPELLRASHIVPWSKNVQARVDPSNGLCLSALYDAAFDKGLIAVSLEHRILISNKLKKNASKIYFQEHFEKLDGLELRAPSKFFINKDFLQHHLDVIFDK